MRPPSCPGIRRGVLLHTLTEEFRKYSRACSRKKQILWWFTSIIKLRAINCTVM